MHVLFDSSFRLGIDKIMKCEKALELMQQKIEKKASEDCCLKCYWLTNRFCCCFLDVNFGASESRDYRGDCH